MRKIFSNKGMIAVAVAIIAAIIGIFSVSSSGSSGALTSGANSTFRPLRSVSAKVITMYESLYGYIYKYDSLVAENEKLAKRNADLEQGYLQYEELSAENERLKKLLNFSHAHSDYVMCDATIVSWSASNWSSSFTINRGSSNSEIAINDSIITESGILVGIVTDVGATTSTVRSIIDTNFSASVDIGGSNTVTASGDFTLMKTGQFRVGYLAQDAGVAIGDTIITSGRGGVFPHGLLVGYVDQVISESGALNLYGSASPAVDLNDLYNVYIITDFES